MLGPQKAGFGTRAGKRVPRSRNMSYSTKLTHRTVAVSGTWEDIVIEFIQNEPLFKWNNELKASDVVALFALCFTLFALVLTFLQIRRGARTRRGDLLLRMFDNYFSNEKVREMFYKLDYHNWQFDVSKFTLSADEPYIDYLLYFFDTLGLMLKRREITLNEVEIFAFQANRVLKNKEMQSTFNGSTINTLYWDDKPGHTPMLST